MFGQGLMKAMNEGTAKVHQAMALTLESVLTSANALSKSCITLLIQTFWFLSHFHRDQTQRKKGTTRQQCLCAIDTSTTIVLCKKADDKILSIYALTCNYIH